MAGDYYEACGLGEDEDQLHKHMTYSMFAPYLFEHYSLGGYTRRRRCTAGFSKARS